MGKTFIRYVGTAIFASAMICLVGFCHGRSAGNFDQARVFGQGLLWTLYAAGACMAYMAAVGVYHTVLSITGLDGGPGVVGRVKDGPQPTRSPPITAIPDARSTLRLRSGQAARGLRPPQ